MRPDKLPSEAVSATAAYGTDGHSSARPAVRPRRMSRTRPRDLTDDQVQDIRERAAAGESSRSLADTFGIRPEIVTAFLRGDKRPEAGGPLKERRPRLRHGASAEERLEEMRARLLARLRPDSPDGCWLLDGPVYHGYALITVRGNIRAHRASYEAFVGPIPDGAVVDHTCHNADLRCKGGPTCLHRRCVNPLHLRVTDSGDNSRSGRAGGYQRLRTICKHGHVFAEGNNTAWGRRKDGTWYRQCRPCLAAAQRRWYVKQKASSAAA